MRYCEHVLNVDKNWSGIPGIKDLQHQVRITGERPCGAARSLTDYGNGRDDGGRQEMGEFHSWIHS